MRLHYTYKIGNQKVVIIYRKLFGSYHALCILVREFIKSRLDLGICSDFDDPASDFWSHFMSCGFQNSLQNCCIA